MNSLHPPTTSRVTHDGSRIVVADDSERPIDVLVVGDANPDLILTGDVVPRFGQVEQLLDHAEVTIGGSATIVACGAARLGLSVALVARVGTDLFGDRLLDAVRHIGVDISRVERDLDVPTGITVVLSAPHDRALLTLPGTIPTLQPTAIADDWLRDSRHVHVGSVFLQADLLSGLPALLKRARAAGCTISLDPNWDPADQWGGLSDVLPLTDVLLPNLAELQALARGSSPQAGSEVPADDVDRAGRLISAQGPMVAVKAGAAGAFGWFEGGRVAAAGTAVEVVDTTGAGDSFDAGFLWAWLAGEPFSRALRAAAVAGSLSTRGRGGTATQASAADIVDLW